MDTIKKIFVKKIELKEGLNDFDLENAKKEITVAFEDKGYLRHGEQIIVYAGLSVFIYTPCILNTDKQSTNSNIG